MELAVVSERDLLRITHTAAAKLRAFPDFHRIQIALAKLDRLARYDGWSDETYPDGTPREWAAVADFAVDCSRDDLWLWQWATNSMQRHGFDAVGFVIAHHQITLTTDYGHAVASFDPNPGNYKFLDPQTLPAPQTLHDCLHVREREQSTRTRKHAQWGIARLLHPVRDPVPQDQAFAVQQAVLDGSLPPCGFHRTVDWDMVNDVADTIRNTARPWNIANISNTIERQQVDTDTKIVLRSLFFVPITWDGKSAQLENGQHRVCGIRAARSSRVLVNIT